MSERNLDRAGFQRGRMRKSRRRRLVQQLIEALRARLWTPISAFRATGGQL
jgi:hypothetical protein